jgi:hypothetical protein
VGVGGTGVSLGKGVGVKVAEGSGVGVKVLVDGTVVEVGLVVAVAVSGGKGVSVTVGSSTCWTIIWATSVGVADGSAGGGGVSVGVMMATDATVDSPANGVPAEAETVVSSGIPWRRVANHPPTNSAVTAIQTKIDRRARRARSVSSSLTMGKIALLASR